MADEQHPQHDRETLAAIAAPARRKAAAELRRARKLLDNLLGDLEKHGDPEIWKKYGDLLLANIGTATREGDTVRVIDYFAEEAPQIGIPGEAHRPLNEIAEEYFRRYTKARNGRRVIEERLADTEKQVAKGEARIARIDQAIEAGDEAFVQTLVAPPKKAQPPVSKKRKVEAAFKGARSFVSSDGFEILVGKKAADNDFLTFRVARSLEMWLHAADYPGSHVVIRNPQKKDLPDRTLIEAAELAAFYSDAREQTKAAVNYTLRKFVNKPRKSAPGLVSLASHKTIMVKPQITAKKKDD
ncbi:MAG TPA: NFACT RNA binding domain-containing protein [Pyrinomonadaceae bacterium]|nr:NFACT RNA binding domain-containing protein [Pyrinomonadaceae bacterium]